MKNHSNLLALIFFTLSCCAWVADAVAADTAVVSPSGSILKMVLGLTVVLAVMALITWLLKRMLPGAGGQQSVVRIVGGVSVGSRERVVVVEVAGRWIVVGVAPGQVNGLANLEIGATQIAENAFGATSQLSPDMDVFTRSFAPSFAQWLKKSTAKLAEKTDAK
ncbi:MAG: flagellar biosynthetic protein FliO [Methylotenera sp.]